MKKQDLLSKSLWFHLCILYLSKCFRLIPVFFFFLLITSASSSGKSSEPKYIIIMIADGWGAKQIEATAQYTGTLPMYQVGPAWREYWMSTFPIEGSYETTKAWSEFNYVLQGPITDSAASATALYSGKKTQNSRISVSGDGVDRLLTIGEIATKQGMGTGAVSTVPVSHATPGAWIAHNDDRNNVYAIASEGFFNDPNATGMSTELYYGGGHGSTFPSADVIIGSRGAKYIDSPIITKLRKESGGQEKYFLVEGNKGNDGGNALLNAASNPGVTKLAGLFDHVYHKADDSGFIADNPTLSDSTNAALTVLNRNSNGFVLMIEGGAIDWACHLNSMDNLIGEMIDFNEAVQTVNDWVDDPMNGSTWHNTLVIVTGDHETGYLTAGPGVFPDVPLGGVNTETISKEKIYSGSWGRSASWEDSDGDSIIDPGETVYWAWNSGGHTNTLIPLYARGVGFELFANDATVFDIMRGFYLDNTDVFSTMKSVVANLSIVGGGSTDTIPPSTPANLITTPISSSQINLSWERSTDDVAVTGYRVYRDGILIATTAGTTYQDTGLSALTTYTYAVSAFDAAANESSQSIVDSDITLDSNGVSVTWVDTVGVVVNGNSITKTASAAWGNGGAVSLESFTGDGGVVFTASAADASATGRPVCGLSSTNLNASYKTIEYAIFLRNTGSVIQLQVYEKGKHKGTFGTYRVGDVFKIQRIGNTIVYKKNGDTFYTSATPANLPLLVDTAIYNNGGEIRDVKLFGEVSVKWIDIVGVVANGDSITKTSSAAWGNGGAGSLESFTGDGGVEFVASAADASATGRPMCGLSSTNRDASYDTIEYAIYLRNTGSVVQIQVYEKGTDKGAFGTYLVGDVFRVERIGSTIFYKRNGNTFYTSTTPTDLPLLVDTAIYNNGGEIRDVKVFGLDIDGGPTDTTQPSTPANLITTPISSSQINLSWEGSTDDVAVTGYRIYRDGTQIATTAGTTYQDTGLSVLTTYTYAVSAFDAAANESAQSIVDSDTTHDSNGVSVTWVDTVGVVVNGNSITKTSSAAWGNGGAVSLESFTGNGGVEFVASAADTSATGRPMCGLSSTNRNASYDTIEYAIFLRNTGSVVQLQVYEKGIDKGTFGTYRVGDVFRIERVENTIVYKKNGDTFYTSATPTNLPLLVDIAIYNNGGEIRDLKLFGAVSVKWIDRVGVVANGNTITKTSSTAWANGGAASLESFTGNGGVEFVASAADASANGRPICGLSSTNRDANYDTIEYAIFLRNTGSVVQIQVYEKGKDKGTFGTYLVGDVFRVERIGRTIFYKRNGNTFYTSTTPTDLPLLVDAAIYNSGGEISDVKVFGVADPKANRPPVLDPIADITVNEGDTVTLTPTATDPDNDSLTFTFSGWMSSNSYTTSYNDTGVHTVMVMVSDGSLIDSQGVVITVINANHAPVLDPISTLQ